MSFGNPGSDFITFIQLVNKLRKDYAAAPKEFQAILSEVDNLAPILQDFKEDIERYTKNNELALSQEEHFFKSVEACEAVVTDIERAVAPYVSTKGEHPTWEHRARWVRERVKWDPAEIDRLRKRLASTFSSLSRSVDNISKKHKVRLEIRQLLQEEKEVLEWLTPAVYNIDQSMSQERRSDKTGQWLLQSPSYQHWMRSAISDLLFLRGDPGVGKTVLTSIIVDYLQDRYNEEDMAVCFYYYDYTRASQEQSPGMIWRAILRQLGQCSGTLPSDLYDLYNSHKDGTKPDLVAIRKTVYALVSKFKRLYIVIDALDECPSAGGYQHTIISEILELYNSCITSIKVLVTSRRSPDIESRFAGFKSLDIRASDEDISKYIEANIQPRYQLLYGHVKRRPDLLDEIKSAIIDAADGIFLLARLHIDSLQRKPTIGDLRRAIKKLDGGSNGYMEAYNKTMQMISRQDEIGNIAINALMWVVHAKRALTRIELLHALATRPGETSLDPDDIPEMDLVLSGCCGLMVLKSDTDIVRLVHRTTQEYLVTHGSEWFKAPHTQISNVCLTYLAFKGVQSRSGLTEEANQQQNAIFPLIDYASWHYRHHINEREKSLTVEELAAIPEKVEVNSQLTISDAVPRYFELGLKYPGITGLHLVAYCGLTEMMPQFLDRYEIDAVDGSGNTPISYAVDQNHVEAVQMLLQKGVQLNFRYRLGDTLLLRAILHAAQRRENMGNIIPRISGALIEAGIDVNAGDSSGRTPLMLAAWTCDLSLIRLLMDHGANLLLKDNESWDVLLYLLDLCLRLPAAWYRIPTLRFREDRRLLALQAIMRHPDAPPINGERGRKYLRRAIGSRKIWWPSDLAKFFFDAGVRLNLEDSQQLLQFEDLEKNFRDYRAIQSRLQPMLEYFLESGIPLHQIIRGSLTLLDFMIIHADEDLLVKALARVPRIEYCAGEEPRWSHLHWACKVGNAMKVLRLVKAGFRDNLVVTSNLSESWTPIDIWYDNGHSLETSGQTLDGWIFAVDSKRGEMSVKRTSEQGIVETEWSCERTNEGKPWSELPIRGFCRECLTRLQPGRGFICWTCDEFSHNKKTYCGMCRHDVHGLHGGHEWTVYTGQEPAHSEYGAPGLA